MRPTLDRVEGAAAALAQLGLGRDGSTLIRWLLAKWAGADADKPPAVITTTATVTFCDAYFAVPGRDPYRWYDPWSKTWGKRATNGGWPVGTVWTQLNRPNAKLRAALSLTPGSTSDGGLALLVVPQPTDGYFEALEAIIPSTQRVPLLELAIWRYRFGVPDEARSVKALVDAIGAELHLSEQERNVAFTDPTGKSANDLELLDVWSDEALGSRLVSPTSLEPVAAPAPGPPVDDPFAEEADYRDLEPFAVLPLESADVDALVGRVETAVQEAGLLLPDPYLVEQCVLALLTGHLILQGPPGTGKTTLARALARAFDCSSELQTATADWSTYDVIGGLQPGIGADNREVLRPWLGHVPRAALRCARTVREHGGNAESEPHQAHWLVIDEFSRAQVDKAIGGLYTMLGGSGERSLELWYENDPRKRVVPIPRRFRIIGTMNDVDASFVYDFSQGLSRRFQFAHVGVPPYEDLDQEVAAALSHAAVWLAAEYPQQAGTQDPVALVERWSADNRVQVALAVLKDALAHLRYPAVGAAPGGWPVGTAQIGDLLRRVVLREAAEDLVPVLDAAMADQIVPQMGGAAPIVLETWLGWLREEHAMDLARTIRAAEHLQNTSAT